MYDLKIMALDIGLKRIGIATCINNIIIPLEPIYRKNRDQASKAIRDLIIEKKIDILVIGIPNEGSSSEEMRRRITHFATLIDFSGETLYIDEDFSSFEAKELSKGIFKQKSDGRLDSISASIILKRYLQKKL